MWKWIAGGLLVLVVLLAGTCYFGYRKFTEGGDTLTVMIGASPERVYASLADPDSLSTWVNVGSTISSHRHGLLVEGDSFTVVQPPLKVGRSGATAGYLVLSSTPGHSLLLRVTGDSLDRIARITQHDSLEAVGDSTRLTISYAATILDSTRMPVRDSSKSAGAVLGFAQKMIVAAMRLSMETDVQRLKARVEGH